MSNAIKKAMCVFVCSCLIIFCASSMTTVNAKAKVKLNKKKATITVGSTVSLKLKNTKKKGTWKSKNKNIATVTKKGKVKGIQVGKTTIIVKVGKKQFKCKITVKAKKQATNTNVGDWLYIEHSNTITITGYKGKSSNVTVPSKIAGKTVIEIGEFAFYNASNIKTLVISEGVKYSGDYSFENCSNLEMIQFPSTYFCAVYGHWNSGMFKGCNNLKKIRVKKGSDFESTAKEMFKDLVELY